MLDYSLSLYIYRCQHAPSEERLKLSDEVIGDEFGGVGLLPALTERPDPTPRLPLCLSHGKAILVLEVVDLVAVKLSHQFSFSLTTPGNESGNSLLLQASLQRVVA